MNKLINVLLISAIFLFMGGCAKSELPDLDDEDIVIIDDDIVVIDDNIDEVGGDDLMENRCSNSELVYLDQTSTITSEELWGNSVSCENLVFQDSFIKLDSIEENGVLETDDFYVSSFTQLVPSWNVIIDDSSSVTISLAIGNSEGYSQFYTVALWKETYKASLSNQEDTYGKLSIDTIIPKIDNIDRIKFKIIFAKSDTDVTALKNISITTVPKNSVNNYDFSVLTEKTIIVEPRQQLSIPVIGNSICSPTSLSMVLNYYSHTESPSEVAGIIFDKGARIYGNWSFNASYAGGFSDLYSRVEYVNDISVIMEYLNNDQPLVLSIRTSAKEDLQGTIMAYPSGHLIVLTGVKLINDEWYALVNDPAEYDDSRVSREYKLEELLTAWRGYMYVLSNTSF